ncbi:EAL domain-containing protein [Roseateles sp. BYS180W]|uniref:EAL domain-containing protein n=1 Tax=Roseateles rivi TaxID=3299028 RepID=A0ABW7FT89_9BURK
MSHPGGAWSDRLPGLKKHSLEVYGMSLALLQQAPNIDSAVPAEPGTALAVREPTYDTLVQLAAQIAGAEMAALMLVEGDQFRMLSCLGLPGRGTLMPREALMCNEALAHKHTLVVPDAAADQKFCAYAVVSGAPHVRFYAGLPLFDTADRPLGTLCVMGLQSHGLDERQHQLLRLLADMAADGLQLRQSLKDEHTQREQQLMSVMQQLQHSEQRFKLAADSGGIGIWDWNVQSGELFWDAWMFRLYDVDPQVGPLSFEDWARVVHPEDLPEATRQLQAALQVGGPAFNTEFRVRWRDASWHTLRASAQVMRDAQGQALRVVGANWDLTELRRLAEHIARQLAAELAEQHELLRVTLRSIGDGVITTDAQGHVQWLNLVAERLTGWSCDEARGQPVAQVFALQDEHGARRGDTAVQQCLSEPGQASPPTQGVLLSRNGQRYGVEETVSPIRSENGALHGTVLVFHDVTEQRRLVGEMRYRATHDQLTGLLNRGEFEARLGAMLDDAHTRNSEHVLMFLDLDQFKLVNDACGHAVGDLMLVQVARLLGQSVRGHDALARLGGDEFAVLLEHCPLAQGRRVAQQICQQMEDFRFSHEGRRFRIGASIGLVLVDDRWGSTSLIMQAADSACYAAKEAGRNRVHVWFETDMAMRERHSAMQWTSRIESALDHDGFELYAQRIVRILAPGQVDEGGVRAEVLLRLRQEDGTVVAPGSFLPAAERYQMVTRIDRWVLSHVLDWLHLHPQLSRLELLSVNVSGQSVGDRAFHAWALQQLHRAGPEVCKRLCLEVTETAVVTSLSDAALFIDQLRQVGVRASLDDFGSGASSFGYLKQLGVDELKIDGQFVRDLINDPLDAAAVRCFVDVAKVVGLHTVAEFVDNPRVLERLRSMGVNYAQGYLIHKPEPLQQLLA